MKPECRLSVRPLNVRSIFKEYFVHPTFPETVKNSVLSSSLKNYCQRYRAHCASSLTSGSQSRFYSVIRRDVFSRDAALGNISARFQGPHRLALTSGTLTYAFHRSHDVSEDVDASQGRGPSLTKRETNGRRFAPHFESGLQTQTRCTRPFATKHPNLNVIYLLSFLSAPNRTCTHQLLRENVGESSPPDSRALLALLMRQFDEIL